MEDRGRIKGGRADHLGLDHLSYRNSDHLGQSFTISATTPTYFRSDRSLECHCATQISLFFKYKLNLLILNIQVHDVIQLVTSATPSVSLRFASSIIFSIISAGCRP